MKKILSTVAALGLVAGLATTASALEFSISGDYTLEGIYLSNGDGGGVDVTASAGDDEAAADAWWMHSFTINPVMKVNDNITMASEIRLADNTVWGNLTNGQPSTYNGGSDDTSDVYVHRLYMDYASPVGKIRVGRVPAGPYGTSYLDSDSRANRIMLWPSALASGPWSTLLMTVKNTENDSTDPLTSNEDSDSYELRVYHKTDDHDAGIRYVYTNVQTARESTNTDTENQALHLYGKYKMNNYFLNAEIVHNFGESENLTTSVTTDTEASAAMLEVGGTFDALSANLMYFYGEGDDPNSNDNEAAISGGTGSEFTPLYILTGRTTGMLNPDVNGVYSTVMTGDGVHGIVASADYTVSDRLTLHGAIGYAQADEETAGWDDEYGWEYNIGAAYKLLDNMTYEAHFGYLDAGDWFNGATPNVDVTENVFIASHSLTMTF